MVKKTSSGKAWLHFNVIENRVIDKNGVLQKVCTGIQVGCQLDRNLHYCGSLAQCMFSSTQFCHLQCSRRHIKIGPELIPHVGTNWSETHNYRHNSNC